MNPSHQTIAIIPLRGSDPEVTGGGAAFLGGKPLLSYTIEAAKASRWVSRTIVTTDDPQVALLARKLGAETPFLRPVELTRPDVPLVRVLQHALLWLEEHEGHRVDIVVLLEVTHPIRPKGLIDRVVEVLREEGLDSVFVAREERHEFWTFNSHGLLERVQPKEDIPREALRPLYKEMGGMATAFRADLIRAAKRIGTRVGLVPLRDASSLIDLHDEDGFRIAQALVAKGDPTP